MLSNKEKRTTIHQKLEVMKRCYKERDVENFELFYKTFFDQWNPPVIIGTDNGPWFYTMDKIKWLITYDWKYWGDLTVDTWNFTIRETEDHDLVRARGVLDFHGDRAWDIDIVMVFSEFGGDYRCRLMQFKIPRTEICPVVILNKSKIEQDKSEKEMIDLTGMNKDESADLMRRHICEKIRIMLKRQRPYLDNVDVRKEMVYVEEHGDGFLFALTGFCVHVELNILIPFRVVGIGQGYEILDAEFSHPFVSNLG